MTKLPNKTRRPNCPWIFLGLSVSIDKGSEAFQCSSNFRVAQRHPSFPHGQRGAATSDDNPDSISDMMFVSRMSEDAADSIGPGLRRAGHCPKNALRRAIAPKVMVRIGLY